MVKEQYPAQVDAAISEMLPHWIETMTNVLRSDVAAELVGEWEGLKIRDEIYKVSKEGTADSGQIDVNPDPSPLLRCTTPFLAHSPLLCPSSSRAAPRLSLLFIQHSTRTTSPPRPMRRSHPSTLVRRRTPTTLASRSLRARL